MLIKHQPNFIYCTVTQMVKNDYVVDGPKFALQKLSGVLLGRGIQKVRLKLSSGFNVNSGVVSGGADCPTTRVSVPTKVRKVRNSYVVTFCFGYFKTIPKNKNKCLKYFLKFKNKILKCLTIP